MRLNRSNIEDFTIGAIIGFGTAPWIGCLSCWTALASGLCYMQGGISHKWIRRFGCTAALWLPIAWVVKENFWLFFICGGWTLAVFHVGYGLPSIQPPDEGSALGRFWCRVMTYDGCDDCYRGANFMTRATIYIALLIPWVIVWNLYGSH